jgi:hypothetical protein
MPIFSIPIEPIALEPDNYHFFIAIKIGVKSARLLLDTVASRTAFDSEKFLRFTKGKHFNPLEVQSVGLGSHEVFTTISSLSSIRFGALKLTHVEVAVLNLSHVNAAYQNINVPEIDGILGADLLMKLKATINLKKLELKLIG